MNDDAITKGRITFREGGDANHYSMLTEDGRWWLALLANGEMTTERQRANFRRLAACWNACDGIPTANLEKAANDPTPVYQLLTDATAQALKLRAAVESIAEYTGEGPATTDWRAIVRTIGESARAALEYPTAKPLPVPTPRAEATGCPVDECTFVDDPQPGNKWQCKCSKCGYTMPF